MSIRYNEYGKIKSMSMPSYSIEKKPSLDDYDNVALCSDEELLEILNEDYGFEAACEMMGDALTDEERDYL